MVRNPGAMGSGAAAAGGGAPRAPDKPRKSTEQLPPWRVQSLSRLVNSEGFEAFIAVVILLNAVVLGLTTYSGLSASSQALLANLDTAFYTWSSWPSFCCESPPTAAVRGCSSPRAGTYSTSSSSARC